MVSKYEKRRNRAKHKDDEMNKEGYPVVVDAEDDMHKPVKGLPKAR